MMLKVGAKNAADSVIQICVAEDFITMKKIVDNVIEQEIEYDHDSLTSMYYYIEANVRSSVDIIYYGDAYYSKICGNLSHKDILQVLEEDLQTDQEKFNTTFYTTYRNASIDNNDIILEVCNTSISDVTASIITKIMGLKNRFNAFICWPSWIVSNYFNNFRYDLKKFGSSIFIVRHAEYIDVIAVGSENTILCYRKFDKDEFVEESEIAETMKYVARESNVKLTDIAIYYVNDESIKTFTNKTSVNVRFISKVIPKNNMILNEYGTSIRMALKAICCCLFGAVIYQVAEIISLDNDIDRLETANSIVDKNIVAESKYWQDINDFQINGINYLHLIKDVLRLTEYSQIEGFSLCKQASELQVKLHILDNDIQNINNRKLQSQGYKFDITSSDEGIICNGKCC